MKYFHLALTIAALSSTVSSSAWAQPGGPDGPNGARPPHPVMAALDSNADGQISAEEISNAANALRSLDQDGDGKLTEADVAPRRPKGDRGGRRGEGGARDAGRFADALKAFDKNADGKIDGEELPERMQRILDRLDTNNDGALDAAELDNMRQSSGRPDGPGEGRPGARGRDLEGQGPGRRGNGPGGGPPSPERFVQHAMTFDADGNGQLSELELQEFAQEMGRQGPPGRGGEQGRPGGRRGGRKARGQDFLP